MAIDSREKRQSVIAISHYMVGPTVTPNSSKDAEWRQEVGYGYPGIAAGEPAPDVQAGFKLAINAPASQHYQQGHYFRFKDWRPAYG